MSTLSDVNEISSTNEQLNQAENSSEKKSDLITIQLEQINASKKRLNKVKKNIDKQIVSFNENPSLFSKASAFWGKIFWWQKAIIGIMLTVPIFAAALAAHLVVLLVVSFHLLVTYTGSSLLLDNHYQNNQADKEKLKQEFSSLASILETIIDSLDKLRKQLGLEIEKLHQENEQLVELIKKLSGKVNALTLQTLQLAPVEERLKLTERELEENVIKIAKQTQIQTDLIGQYQNQLQQLAHDANLKQSKLSTQIDELNQVKETLADDLKKAKQIGDILQGTVKTLSQAQNPIFQKRLENFLNNQELTLDHFANSLLNLEEELRLVKEKLEAGNERHEVLLDRQEEQVVRLTSVANHAPIDLNKISLFSSPKLLEKERINLLENQLNTTMVSVL